MHRENHPNDFKKIDPYVLFYCLSQLNKEDKKVVEKASELIMFQFREKFQEWKIVLIIEQLFKETQGLVL